MSFDDDEADEATLERHERRITRCSSCRARIVFLRTAAGKQMPVEADTVEATDETFEAGRHESHFAKCAAADKHRRSR
jgi:hypothetical protein